MEMYLLAPEVAGEIGENTIIDNFKLVREKSERPKVTYLHYVFTGWLGDELLECTPCFIVTEKLAKEIEKSSLTGWSFEEIEISLSDEFLDMSYGKEMTKFRRLVPNGSVKVVDDTYTQWSEDDFCMTSRADLVVSKNALELLRQHNIEHCDIRKLNN